MLTLHLKKNTQESSFIATALIPISVSMLNFNDTVEKSKCVAHSFQAFLTMVTKVNQNSIYTCVVYHPIQSSPNRKL